MLYSCFTVTDYAKLLLASSLLDADACESGYIDPQSGYNDPQVAGNDPQVAAHGGGGTCEAKRAGRVDRTGSLGLELQVHQ